jgi:hypothetical protein
LGSYATDLVVQEAGPVGTYGSIGAAVTAAVDGDRIIINNMIMGLPWVEDILIDKSLTFLSAIDNQRFLVQGDYDIVHAPGREVIIIGMENSIGDISAVANGVTSDAFVTILSCYFPSTTRLIFNMNYFHLDASSNIGISQINYHHGKIIGNDMAGGYIYLQDDNVSSDDTLYIVGNKLRSMDLSSPDYYLYIANNLLNSTYSTSNAIGISSLKAGAGSHVIRNNSIISGDNAIYITSAAVTNVVVENNVIVDYSSADYGIYTVAGPTMSVSFNYIESTFDNGTLIGFTNNGTNFFLSNFSINTTSGTSSWSATIDGGSGSVEQIDLDLTRNDAGCLGGSYALSNFYPIDGVSSKVYFLTLPSLIIAGASNTVKAYSFDR